MTRPSKDGDDRARIRFSVRRFSSRRRFLLQFHSPFLLNISQVFVNIFRSIIDISSMKHSLIQPLKNKHLRFTL
jgi:hypothetical protein